MPFKWTCLLRSLPRHHHEPRAVMAVCTGLKGNELITVLCGHTCIIQGQCLHVLNVVLELVFMSHFLYIIRDINSVYTYLMDV